MSTQQNYADSLNTAAKTADAATLTRLGLLGRQWNTVAAALERTASAAKSATNATKKLAQSQRSLMGFDEIQKLAKEGSSSGGGSSKRSSSGSKSSKPTTAVISTAWLEDLARLYEKLGSLAKKWVDSMQLGNLRTELGHLMESLDGVSRALSWSYENLLVPLGKWTLNEAVPAVLHAMAGAFSLLGAALNLVKPAAAWVWENFLKPMLSWAGNTAAEKVRMLGDALDWAAQQLNKITQILTGNTDWRSKLYNIGGMLVEGLKQGILDPLLDIAAWIKTNIVDPILHPIKRFFGIASPSTVFAEIGGFLIAGLCNGMKTGLDGLWGKLSEKWNGLKGHFSDIAVKITAAVRTTWADIKEKWESLTSHIKDKTVSFTAKLLTTAESLWQSFKSGWAGKSLGLKVNWTTTGLNAVQEAISRVLFSGRGWPKLAFAARGGVFSAPTLTMLGEAGREAVVPLENNTGWMDVLARRIAEQNGGSSGAPQTITVQCVLDGRIVAENTVAYINGEARRTGVNPLAAGL